jgi:Mn2+/Fe2+ NRAMP family transporter
VAIAIGLFELAFFYVAWVAHPGLNAMLAGAADMPLGNRAFLYLVTANIGAVVMPWMIFYQQSAIADKKLRPEHYGAARLDTAIGAVVTQAIMAAVLIAAAATIAPHHSEASLDTVGQMSEALTPFLGPQAGRVVFGLGVLGAALVAAIVSSLALAWGIGEVAGYRRSLEHHPLDARWFYGVYAVCVAAGAALIGVSPDLVALNVGVQVMNALLLPLVLGFLVALAVFALPPERRLSGWYLWVAAIACGVTSLFGVFGGLAGLF